MDKNLRSYLAELIGTFALVFLGAGSVCVNQIALRTETPAPGLIGIAVAHGLALAVALAATLPMSAGFLNPAITLMLWVFKRLETPRAFGLMFVQALGAVLAGGLLRLVFTENDLVSGHLGTPHLNLRAFDVAGITPEVLLKGIAIELASTFILTFVIFGTILDPRVRRLQGFWSQPLTGLWPGLTLTAITLATFALTGAAANPARWFGTVVWEKTVPVLSLQTPFADHPVYWFGPAAGALLAGAVYIPLLWPSQEEPVAAAGSLTSPRVMTGASATLFRTRK